MAEEYSGRDFRQTFALGLAKITCGSELAANGLGKNWKLKHFLWRELPEFGESLRRFRAGVRRQQMTPACTDP